MPLPLIKFPIAAVPFPSPVPVFEFGVVALEVEVFDADFEVVEAVEVLVFLSDFSLVFTRFFESVPVMIFSFGVSFFI